MDSLIKELEELEPVAKLYLEKWDEFLENAPVRWNSGWFRLLLFIDDFLKVNYPNNATRGKHASKFRRGLREKKFEKKIYNESLKLIGLTKEESDSLKAEYKLKVESRNRAIKSLPVIYVADVMELIVSLIGSESSYNKIVGLLLATGCRSIEILKVSKFHKVKGIENRDKIKIVGIAKHCDSEPVVRHLLCLKPSKVIATVRYLRKKLDIGNLGNEDLASNVSYRLNKAFKNAMGRILDDDDYVDTLTAHKARYIYGACSYELYGKPLKIPRESFIQGELGHVSPYSTKSYLCINVEGMGGRGLRASESDDKIQIVVDYLSLMERQPDLFINQPALRKKLGFGTATVSAGYKKFRELKALEE